MHESQQKLGPGQLGVAARRWQVPSPPTSACSEHRSSVPIRYSGHELSSDSCHSSGNIWLYPETLFGCHDYGKGDGRPETLPESTVHRFPFQRHQQGWDGSWPGPIKGDLVTKKMCPGRAAHLSCSSTSIQPRCLYVIINYTYRVIPIICNRIGV